MSPKAQPEKLRKRKTQETDESESAETKSTTIVEAPKTVSKLEKKKKVVEEEVHEEEEQSREDESLEGEEDEDNDEDNEDDSEQDEESGEEGEDEDEEDDEDDEDDDGIDSDLEDDEEEEEEEDGEEKAQPATLGFSGVLDKLLKQDVKETANPILSKRPSISTDIQKEKEKDETKTAIKDTRKERMEKGHVEIELLGGEAEKRLLKVATKGVVKLFNAVNKHQRSLGKDRSSALSSAKKPGELSKDGFLKLLKEAPTTVNRPSYDTQSLSQQGSSQAVSKWDVFRDDYATRPSTTPSDKSTAAKSGSAHQASTNEEDVSFAFP